MKDFFNKCKNKIWNILKLIWKKIVSFFKQENTIAFLIIYGLGIVMFSIEAIGNHFTLPMYGDYTSQTYSFYTQGYYQIRNFFKTGEYPLFDFTNYLGANYLGTQSFYYVFSPLFYLLALCPESFLYQGIYFHMILKFAIGGFFMYLLLRKHFNVSYLLSIIGGFIYAYSGWTLFYLWFHFGDVMAFFPLFLIGVEKCLKERKGLVLALGLFLCGMANYFFLVNFCIFGLFYCLYRWIYIYGLTKKRGYSISQRWGALLQGIIYCVIGVAMAGICLMPSFYSVLENSRTQTGSTYLLDLLGFLFKEPSKSGFSLKLGELKSFKEIFSWPNIKELLVNLFIWPDRSINEMEIKGSQNVGYMLANWLFMNTNCWDSILFDNARLDNSLGGFFITTPLTMLLVPSIVEVIKSKRPWAIFGLVMAIALPFFPITSYAAFGFTSLYGRWELWLVALGIIFIIPTLDHIEKVKKKWVIVNLCLNYVLAFIAFFIAIKGDKLPTNDQIKLFGQDISLYLILAFVELLLMGVVCLFYLLLKKKVLIKVISIFIILEVTASTIITVESKGFYKWSDYFLSSEEYSEQKQIIKEIQKEDKSFYRIMNVEATRLLNNLPSLMNYNGASVFNSTYDYNLDTFKERARSAYGNTWSMGTHEKRLWLDQYLGVKYYIIDKTDKNNVTSSFTTKDTSYYDGRVSKDEANNDYDLNLSWNFELYKEYEYYDVYINKDFNGIGYMVDNYMLDSVAGMSEISSYYDELYTSVAIIYDEDENLLSSNEELTKVDKSTYSQSQRKFAQSGKWNLYYSPREDRDYQYESDNLTRHYYKMNKDSFNKDEINSYQRDDYFSGKLLKRWEDKGYFGDEFIMELKNSKSSVCSLANENNKCYVDFTFKLGPKAIVSLYHGDKLLTQDAHCSAGSVGTNSTEWKRQRGFYVSEPFDRVVIEFIDDTKYDQIFSNGSLSGLDFYYIYQDEVSEIESVIDANLLSDVTYSSSTFTFKSSTSKDKIAVTNIPIDKGWTLMRDDGQEIETFDVNGGFIGFVANKGDYSYTLTYMTIGLKKGSLISFGGLLALIAASFVYKRKKTVIQKETI